MTIVAFKNPVYVSADNSVIDLEFNSSVYGWVPMTINLADDDKSASIIEAKSWLANNSGQIAAYTVPVEPVVIPAQVSMRQARLALLQAGHLATVTSMMSGLPEASQIEWEYASHVERSSTLTQAMGSALSLSSSDLDDLFVLAATL